MSCQFQSNKIMQKNKTQNIPNGSLPSPFDLRTFGSKTTTNKKQKGGERYKPEDIESQKKVGICTSISLTQNTRKATKRKYSAEFQYLLQKKYYDGNWSEGSSIFHALKVAKNFGLLPEKYWIHTTYADRNLPYHEYIAKLKAIPDWEIKRLIKIANNYKIKAYAKVPVTRDAMAQAIDGSKAGILARFVIGSEWWRKPVEPLRKPIKPISGHAVTESNYDGDSFRNANTWSYLWADGGTAYFMLNDYKPTECWRVWYWDEEVPKEIQKKLGSRESIIGKIMNLIQQIVLLVLKLK